MAGKRQERLQWHWGLGGGRCCVPISPAYAEGGAAPHCPSAKEGARRAVTGALPFTGSAGSYTRFPAGLAASGAGPRCPCGSAGCSPLAWAFSEAAFCPRGHADGRAWAEVLRPVGGQRGADRGAARCTHYRGLRGIGGILTAAVRAWAPLRSPRGTAGAREAVGPTAPSCPVTSGLWRESCSRPPSPVPASAAPAPITAQQTPQGFPDPEATLGTPGNTCLPPGSSAAGVGAHAPAAAAPTHSGWCRVPHGQPSSL